MNDNANDYAVLSWVVSYTSMSHHKQTRQMSTRYYGNFGQPNKYYINVQICCWISHILCISPHAHDPTWRSQCQNWVSSIKFRASHIERGWSVYCDTWVVYWARGWCTNEGHKSRYGAIQILVMLGRWRHPEDEVGMCFWVLGLLSAGHHRNKLHTVVVKVNIVVAILTTTKHNS